MGSLYYQFTYHHLSAPQGTEPAETTGHRTQEGVNEAPAALHEHFIWSYVSPPTTTRWRSHGECLQGLLKKYSLQAREFHNIKTRFAARLHHELSTIV